MKRVAITGCKTRVKRGTWTSRDQQLLYSIAVQCRAFTEAQLINGWWPNGLGRARKRITQLRKAGLLERYRMQIHPLLDLQTPMVSWQPGQPIPDNVAEISKQLRKRWSRTTESVTVFVASARLANLFGRSSSFRGAPHVLQATHDLHTSQVFIHYRRTSPNLAGRWIGEDSISQPFSSKNPDAWILDNDGIPLRIVEFGGSYDSARVAEFVGFATRRELPFELW